MADFPEISPEDIDWDSGGFFLRGKTGIGKTHLATALAKEYMRPTHPYSIIKKIPVGGDAFRYEYPARCLVWIATTTLISRIKGTFNKDSTETEYSIIQDMIKPKVMVFDDLGSEKITEFSSSTIYAIMAERINRCKATIVTSNNTFKEINEWNARLASRLSEMATLRLPDGDLRAKRAKSRNSSAVSDRK